MSYGTFNSKRVGIIQSNYIPWKGYFDFIASCDEFVLLDEVQYTRRDWRNRNRIKTAQGPLWLTIPVNAKGRFHQRIDETTISDAAWWRGHMQSLQCAYARAPYFNAVWPFVQSLYISVSNETLLSKVNETMIRSIAAYLGIDTRIRRSDEFTTTRGKNERLIDICSRLGASSYLSGPAAKAYMDETQWAQAGISVEYKSYKDYPEYDQLHPPFDHLVSVLDLLFHTGPQATGYFRTPSNLV